MDNWFEHHKPIIVEPDTADHEDILFEVLAKKSDIGSKTMCTAIRKANGVTFREAPIRAWLAAHKGALPTPIAEASSSSAPSMALLQLSDMDEHADFLRQQLVDSPAITVSLLRDKLIQERGVSCEERTMQTWLERARAIVPKRVIKRGSSDLPTLENLEEHGDYLRALLVDGSSLGYRKLREAIKTKGFLVSEKSMRIWLDRYHWCVDREGLLHYEAELLE